MGIGGLERQSESRMPKGFRSRGSVLSTRTSRCDMGCVLKHGTAVLKLWRACGVLRSYTESTPDIIVRCIFQHPCKNEFRK